MSSDDLVQLKIPAKIFRSLDGLVEFDNERGMRSFVADAINSYIELIKFSRAGFRIGAAHPSRDDVLTLRFPFDSYKSAKTSASDVRPEMDEGES